MNLRQRLRSPSALRQAQDRQRRRREAPPEQRVEPIWPGWWVGEAEPVDVTDLLRDGLAIDHRRLLLKHSPMSRESKSGGPWKSPLIWVMAALFLISAGWFAVLYHRGVEKDSLDMEFAKALLQVGIVSVAATLLSVLVFDHQRRSALSKEAAAAAEKQLEFREDILKGTIGRITGAYNATKRARRTVRALGLCKKAGSTLLRLERYDECMAEVNDAQLELEAIKSDVKTSQRAYPSASKITAGLKGMEQYLGALIEEYEAVRVGIGDDTFEFPLSKVPGFRDFVGPSSGSGFSQDFSGGHDQARGAIRGDILQLNIPTRSTAKLT